jgi:hypothetical protein
LQHQTDHDAAEDQPTRTAKPKTFLNDFDLFNGNEPTCSGMTSNVPFQTTTKMKTTKHTDRQCQRSHDRL